MTTKNKIGVPLNTVLAKLATAKAIGDADYRLLNSGLSSGTYPIEVKVRMQGALKKGDPYRQRLAAKANPWALLGKALSKLNAVSLEALVRESLETSDEEASAIKDAAQEAIDRLVEATESECAGKLTAALVWELL